MDGVKAEKSTSTLESYKDYVKNHATMAFYIIIILVILVIYVTVYYRGIFGIGPFMKESFTNESSEIKTLVKSINAAFL
jgi:hypothetical protein